MVRGLVNTVKNMFMGNSGTKKNNLRTKKRNQEQKKINTNQENLKEAKNANL